MRKILMSLLLLEIARGLWFIEPVAAEAYKPLIVALLKGDPQAINTFMEVDKKKMKMRRSYCLEAAAPSIGLGDRKKLEDATPGSVAITPIQGPIMKQDYCGAPGTQTMLQWMQKADQNANVIGHLIDMDTPGGTVDGTFSFSEAIKNLSKPVVTFVNEMSASAGYLIASASKEIMANGNMAQIGSIGTYISFYDYTEYYESMGIKLVEAYATASTEKNKGYREAIKGDTSTLIKDGVDPFNEAFMNTVSRNRFGRGLDKANTLKGQLHLTGDAKKHGLIDSVGTMSDAINRVKQLSKKS